MRILNVSSKGRVFIRKNKNLRRTRGLLPPQLISGKLDVEHLDIDTGDPESAVAATEVNW
jgi:hypothetical protein